MNVLVTGGAGYIGSHTCVALIEAGHVPVVVDNFCNAHPEVLNRIERIAGRRPVLVQGDVRDRGLLEATIRRHACEAVIHFAGLKAVFESTEKPLDYYDNNLVGTLRVAEAAQATGLRSIIFSSSATVYGVPQALPLTEDHPLSAVNPYGATKLAAERLLEDFALAHNAHRIALLRYFNPIGAHASGLIGEDPQGTPNNLMPYICQTAIGRRPFLNVWGDDYATPDGTGVRDYIHVEDLAAGHVCALHALAKGGDSFTVNLGTGRGYSVMEMVKAFESASGRPVPVRIGPRRTGDVASCYADPRKAEALLGWRARQGLPDMCRDSWNWQQQNPNGYA